MNNINVIPKNDNVRKVVRHPTAGAFPATGSASWPADQFTYRRLRDGDISKSDARSSSSAPSRSPPRAQPRNTGL